ncbi:unnamed protein product [Vitrella brassicaformis CCMP3155]|uniref:Adaptor protein ClpS core domain-containing protein n=2 Tax=Vitrella brassicaformis TaxID=1169539 RepID=A0A0G4EQU6_VITBC|nr:unnamed protein product [Vitrella brassicaformis CCMP3155]|eukprot:CEL99848.1 unnamed protein product [Vitrella brassicaformis CCMP3155]
MMHLLGICVLCLAWLRCGQAYVASWMRLIGGSGRHRSAIPRRTARGMPISTARRKAMPLCVLSMSTSADGTQMEKIKEVKKAAVRLLDREETKDEEEEELDEDQEERSKQIKDWRVLLHNDDIHTFRYVTDSIIEVIPQISSAKAHTITVEAHKNGVATVTATWKDRAERYCVGLQRSGLTVSVAPDKDFKKNRDSGGGEGDEGGGGGEGGGGEA